MTRAALVNMNSILISVELKLDLTNAKLTSFVAVGYFATRKTEKKNIKYIMCRKNLRIPAALCKCFLKPKLHVLVTSKYPGGFLQVWVHHVSGIVCSVQCVQGIPTVCDAICNEGESTIIDWNRCRDI